MKKRARPISDDLTRQANEYEVALASDKHSTPRERRTTRSNSLLSGAPTALSRSLSDQERAFGRKSLRRKLLQLYARSIPVSRARLPDVRW